MTRRLRILLAIAALLAAVPVWHTAHTARYEYSNFHEPRTVPVRPHDAQALGLRDVAFTTPDLVTLRGWYLPSRTGAAVVLAAGSLATRTGLLDHARLLHAAGFGVLMFDWPGLGESGGRIGFGAAERSALHSAVTFLVAQPGIRPGQVGCVSFSMGSWMALAVAAADTRIRAVVAEGVFDDPWSQLRSEYENSGPASQLGAYIGARLAGVERHPVRSREIVAAIAPRPILFVAGTNDVTVPAILSRAVHDAARAPKEFWLVKGASHGTYLQADATYGRRMVGFLQRALSAAAPPLTAH